MTICCFKTLFYAIYTYCYQLSNISRIRTNNIINRYKIKVIDHHNKIHLNGENTIHLPTLPKEELIFGLAVYS